MQMGAVLILTEAVTVLMCELVTRGEVPGMLVAAMLVAVVLVAAMAGVQLVKTHPVVAPASRIAARVAVTAAAVAGAEVLDTEMLLSAANDAVDVAQEVVMAVETAGVLSEDVAMAMQTADVGVQTAEAVEAAGMVATAGGVLDVALESTAVEML